MKRRGARRRVARLRAQAAGAVLLIAAAMVWEGSVLAALFPIGEVPKIDFARLIRRTSPNEYLACPRLLCQAAADLESPILAVPVERLQAAWQAALAEEPRVTLLREDPELRQLDYVQRTPVMKFPDLVTARFYDERNGQSTFAVYSRSVYGYGDGGANRQRVTRWLALMRAELARGSP